MAKKVKQKKEDNVEKKNKKTNSKKEKKVVDKKNDKKKKKTHVFGPIEFSFNFISLVIAISIALYFGGRCFYYYSLQSEAKKKTGMTLNNQVLEHNKLVKDNSDGLHKDENGYFFKGKVENNYVWFANRMFRVMRVNEDGSVKLVTNDLVASFMWGPSEKYDDSNVRVWLTKTDEIVSGAYYDTIPNPSRFVKNTNYTLDVLSDTKVVTGKEKFEDSITTLTLEDYVSSGGKSGYLNNGKLFFILGYNEDNENLYVEEDGSIMSCASYDGYGIRGVFTMSPNIPISQGKGTKKNPYMIDQGNDTNHVDGYVKLGDDTWKVFEDKEGKLKMYLNGYIKTDGKELVRNFSYGNNVYYYFDESNIGYYLHADYVEKLSYRKYIIDNQYPYGEINDEIGFTYANTYSRTFTGSIALLSIFDYVSNNELSDFFRDNVGNGNSTTQYSVLSSGLLEEADITDSKHIVPVISISVDSIKSGNGRIDNPYVVG